MVEGILFVLIVINFSLTLTIFIQYNKNKSNVEEVKREMSEMLLKFNKNADRNIHILEDRIKKTKILLNQLYEKEQKNVRIEPKQSPTPQEIVEPKTPPKKKKPIMQKPKTKQTKIFKNENKEQINPNFTHLKDYGLNTIDQDEKPKKTFVQKAYQTSTKNTFQFQQFKSKESKINTPINQDPAEEESFEEYTPQNQINKSFSTNDFNYINGKKQQDIPTTNEDDIEQYENELFEGSKKETTHQIAKLIGEGKSLEEISKLIGVSLGEIKLFTTLFRKRILQNDNNY